MSNSQSQARDFRLDADRPSMPLTTFIGAVAAILLAVFTLGAALTGGAVQEPEPLTLIGP
jgi:hypothetical protein